MLLTHAKLLTCQRGWTAGPDKGASITLAPFRALPAVLDFVSPARKFEAGSAATPFCLLPREALREPLCRRPNRWGSSRASSHSRRFLLATSIGLRARSNGFA